MGRVCVLDMARDMTKGFVRQYVIQSGDYEGLYTMTHNEDEALHVLYNTWEAGSLQALDNSDSLHLYLAFIAGPGDANNGNLVEGAYSFVYLGGSNERNAANSPPQLNYNTLPEGDKKVSETGTWAVDVPKQEGRFAFIELYPEWTNLDGKRPSEQIVFYDERNGFFGITKNLEEQKKFSEGTVQVVSQVALSDGE
ncbi:hypothetical protein FRB97_006312 [Tulasnella sp. 331]|nr:hypothetical protein FRB97_006312 [Tulasnella sp. 331]KAG8878117.1 hypothetical protein FRB98_006390 [Tulasnella sp. 332]